MNTPERLAGMCDLLMTWPACALPCSHNLLATLRDDARQGAMGDDQARAFFNRLIQRLVIDSDDPSMRRHTLDWYERVTRHPKEQTESKE